MSQLILELEDKKDEAILLPLLERLGIKYSLKTTEVIEDSSSQVGIEKSASISNSGNFLTSIANLGEVDENLSEQDEVILAKEVDSIHGWHFK